MAKAIFSNIVTAIVVLVICYFVFNKSGPVNQVSSIASTTPSVPAETIADNSGMKTFVFDNFHGSKNISLKFQFQYPSSWNNEGQYFSPQQIEYYDLYSVKAPFYFDLIRADIFDQTEFKDQINTDKRKSPDSHGTISGQKFERYDLIDYGSYGGDSAGRVIIFVGPKINVDGVDYFLVFHWEEKPLTAVVLGNDPTLFENAVKSLKFSQ